MPAISDVRTLLGDDAWWAGPPMFGVRPLDVASMPFNQTFSVAENYVHVGSAEMFSVDYEVWNGTSAAKGHMTSVQSALGTSAVAGPKVGDQAIYYGSQASGAAPFQTVTIVRVGQVVALIGLDLKDGFPKVAQLGKIAVKVVSRLKDVLAGKVASTPLSTSDAALLPPANLDITMLGSTTISVESAMVMLDAPSFDALAQTLRGSGVSDVVFGDYALNSDTHMEVRAAVFNFSTAKDAADWIAGLRGTTAADQLGLYDAAHGWYIFPFAAGTKAALLICRSTADTEAASRACEGPLSSITSVWKLSLGSQS
ncbi:MAG: hypothetical protein QOJ10_1470 [Chloroflexota bacterium]|nr:hypothetical protein [Chloroflexota bacterium]